MPCDFLVKDWTSELDNLVTGNWVLALPRGLLCFVIILLIIAWVWCVRV